MAYATSVPVVRLSFSDGFKYYGDATVITPSATVNLPVGQVTHAATGESLSDGALIPAQDATAFDVPDPRAKGWAAGNSHVTRWSYDVSLVISATGQPVLLWSGTINPRRDPVVITPGMGALTTGEATSITETAPGEYTIGA